MTPADPLLLTINGGSSSICYQAKKWIGSFAAALELDGPRNMENAPVISSDAGCFKVRVIRTDEELMIARSVARILSLDPIQDS